MQPDVPLWLNADIIAGPVNALSEPLDAQLFLGLCRRYFPDAVLSVGWTTRFGPDLTNFQLVPSFFFCSSLRLGFALRPPIRVTSSVRGVFRFFFIQTGQCRYRFQFPQKRTNKLLRSDAFQKKNGPPRARSRPNPLVASGIEIQTTHFNHVHCKCVIIIGSLT